MNWRHIGCLCLFIANIYQTNAQSCCCTGAGSNWNITPNLSNHLIGARYTWRNTFSVYPQSLNPELSGKLSDQQMHTVEIYGRFKVHKKLQLSVYLPVSYLQESSAGNSTSAWGLSDMTFLLQYAVLNPMPCNGKNSQHQLRVGAGVKLPSGQFKMDNSNMFTTNLQLGSGSIDFLLNAIYTYRYKSFGFNLPVSYKLNTVNPSQYRFGDKAQAGINAFYIFEVKQVKLMPLLGLSYEHNFQNHLKGDALNYTGGDYVTTTAGFDVYTKHVAISTAFTPALVNKLSWGGELQQKYLFETGVYYIF